MWVSPIRARDRKLPPVPTDEEDQDNDKESAQDLGPNERYDEERVNACTHHLSFCRAPWRTISLLAVPVLPTLERKARLNCHHTTIDRFRSESSDLNVPQDP
jgi:hypothetical protein